MVPLFPKPDQKAVGNRNLANDGVHDGFHNFQKRVDVLTCSPQVVLDDTLLNFWRLTLLQQPSKTDSLLDS
jgi:hypothetical protein